MITLPHAEVHWLLNDYCQFQCSYCQPRFRNGHNLKSVDQYLSIIEKLQETRYKHHDSIYWKIGGGEPLHFPHLSAILKKMKERPCKIRLDTSGGDDWFLLYSVLDLVDTIKLSYHEWQTESIFDFLLEQCQEKNIKVLIIVPLLPGKIAESREKIEQFKNRGFNCVEQVLRKEDGTMISGYTRLDKNRILGLADDYVPEPVVIDPNKPDPNYVDLSVVNKEDPIYTGKMCYAGVDWLFINEKGWPAYSQCRGRMDGAINVFHPSWKPPEDSFPCSMIQCRDKQDHRKIRVNDN